MLKEIKWLNEFRCIHCQGYVSGEYLLSGVRNRNHCPYCLWSKHLDLFRAGDRLSACKAGMQPVGLALKRNLKKYGNEQSGELMLIHRCTDCGSISTNRIAADDDADRIFGVYEESLGMSDHKRAWLAASGVAALTEEDRNLVYRRLFGGSPAKEAPFRQDGKRGEERISILDFEL